MVIVIVAFCHFLLFVFWKLLQIVLQRLPICLKKLGFVPKDYKALFIYSVFGAALLFLFILFYREWPHLHESLEFIRDLNKLETKVAWDQAHLVEIQHKKIIIVENQVSEIHKEIKSEDKINWVIMHSITGVLVVTVLLFIAEVVSR